MEEEESMRCRNYVKDGERVSNAQSPGTCVSEYIGGVWR